VLGDKDNGSQVQLASGQVLEVSLDSNPTTGFRWEVSEADGAVLTQVGEVEFREAPKESEEMVGVGGTETFRFSSATGKTTLTLVYRRSWEEGIDPLETFSVEVEVK
jgi:inhibitor of cysteine peptidase